MDNTCTDCNELVPRCKCGLFAERDSLRAALFQAQEAAKSLARKELAAAEERDSLRAALSDVVDVDWVYSGPDADTGNPDSLYSRVKRGRAALGTR